MPLTSSDPFRRPDSDCVELVWENGQIMMQGKARKSSNSNILQTIGPKPQDSKNANCSKMTKFSTMDSLMIDFPMLVPSCETGMDQDVDPVPWLSYPMEEPLHHSDYTSDFLHNFSSNEKDNRGESSEVPQLLLPFKHCAPRSGVCDVIGNNVGNNHHYASRDSGFTNFPYLSRPGKGSHVIVNPSKKLENDDKRCTLSGRNRANSTLVNFDSGCSGKERVSHKQSIMARANENPDPLPTNPPEDLFSDNQPLFRENISRNYGSQNQPRDRPISKAGACGGRNMEPVIAASSECSENSAERASNEPTRNLKRKSRETEESSSPSEEAEEESVGAKKHVSARLGSKRSRASEVHNISERRRRDRINDKMRALQDLIPNCNKADKASILDEAIAYLRTLQLQLQILSMAAGMYMQPMMLPPGMQPIHGAHMPHFPPMGLGMDLGMGFGINILNMNNAAKIIPFQGLQYPVPFPGIPGSTLQAFPQPGQGLPISSQQASVVPPSNYSTS